MWDITPAPPPGDRFIKTDADTQVPRPFVCVCETVCFCQLYQRQFDEDTGHKGTAFSACAREHVAQNLDWRAKCVCEWVGGGSQKHISAESSGCTAFRIVKQSNT